MFRVIYVSFVDLFLFLFLFFYLLLLLLLLLFFLTNGPTFTRESAKENDSVFLGMAMDLKKIK